MAPIALAMSLAQFAPQIIKWLSGSDKAEDAAKQVVDIASLVTGQQGEEAIFTLQQNPDLAQAFRQKILANAHAMDLAFLADVQNARTRDILIRQLGQKNWRPDIMFAIAVGVIVFLTYLIWTSNTFDDFQKGVFTLILGRFTGYLDQVYNFEFSSTRSSKTKDLTIGELSKK